MRFLDTNIVVYALLKPTRKLQGREAAIKTSAKAILERVDAGEKVATSIVHISEIANIIEKFNRKYAHEALFNILTSPNIEIEAVDRDSYIIASEHAHELDIGINDGLALVIMEKKKIAEVYSFDSDFDRVAHLKRLEN